MEMQKVITKRITAGETTKEIEIQWCKARIFEAEMADDFRSAQREIAENEMLIKWLEENF